MNLNIVLLTACSIANEREELGIGVNFERPYWPAGNSGIFMKFGRQQIPPGKERAQLARPDAVVYMLQVDGLLWVHVAVR